MQQEFPLKNCKNQKKSGIFQIDFKNAFNAAKRRTVLEAVAKFLLSVAPSATHNTVICFLTTHT